MPLAGLPPEDARAAADAGNQVKERLWRRMVHECEVMVQHALSTGCVIPVEVMELLDQAISAPDEPVSVIRPEKREGGSPADTAISRFVISRFALLASAHAGLAAAIAPATPEAVRLMAEEHVKHPLWCEFGPLPLVRQMLGLALLSLVALLAVSISAVVNSVNMSKTLLELSGYPLLMVEGFLVSAGSLGACFANLQRINTFISDSTYDPRVQSTYWTRWVMGVISGIMLSQLVYPFFQGQPTGDASTATPATIMQPLLALLGGYSVDFVHGLLKRAINAVGNFFGVSMDGESTGQRRSEVAEAPGRKRLALTAVTPERAALPPAP